MSIPLPVVPNYEIELPVSKKTVKYRPFLIKEEKIFLLAMEEGTAEAQKNAMLQVIENCTFGKVKINELPVADVEYLFIKIRERSIGETVPVVSKCRECGETFANEIMLGEIELVNDVKDVNVKIADNTIATMRYPTIESTKDIVSEKLTDTLTDAVAACLSMVTVDEVVYVAAEMTKEDIVNWLDGLTDDQFTELSNWMNDLPRIVYHKTVKCPKCEAENDIHVEGLVNFFV